MLAYLELGYGPCETVPVPFCPLSSQNLHLYAWMQVLRKSTAHSAPHPSPPVAQIKMVHQAGAREPDGDKAALDYGFTRTSEVAARHGLA